MQINNILARQQDPMALGKRLAAAEGLSNRAAAGSSATGGASSGSSRAVGEIFAQYDVTKITPQKFSEMLQKLQAAGVINADDMRELSQIRTDMDQAGIRPDETVNLLDFSNEKLQKLQKQLADLDPNTQPSDRAALQQSISSAQRRFDWLQKFAAMHSSPELVGLSAVA